jgi:hypothetical protein
MLRAVAADFFFNCWYLEIPSDNRIRHMNKIYMSNAHTLQIHYLASSYAMHADI